MGEAGGGSENFMFCIDIWIPHEILSILGIHERGKTKFYPPLHAKKISGAMGAQLGPNVVGTSSMF